MKTDLTRNDKISIIKGLQSGTFNLTELNHLVREFQDFEAVGELFGEVVVELTSDDKRQLLSALKKGVIDIDLIPDLSAKVKENFFLQIMIESTSQEVQNISF